MKLILVRDPDNQSDATMGSLNLDTKFFYTIERPWLDNKSFLSCVPEGRYEMLPFVRPGSGMLTYSLVNPELDVYQFESDIPEGKAGRFLILIHSGNTVKDVVGCIAPGKYIDRQKLLVGRSRDAFTDIMDMLGFREGHTIDISRSELV